MISNPIQIAFQFVPYGTRFEAEKNTIVLDVGMNTVPGVIDHHHPDAEPECTASLIVEHPSLVLDNVDSERIKIITHHRPDFDAIAAIFLISKLVEKGKIDPVMEKIAGYTKMVDSASIPKDWDLPATPYAILRALFLRIRKGDAKSDLERVRIGVRLMNFLYDKASLGDDIFQNRRLFAGIERYERAMARAEDDYFNYLRDLDRCQMISLDLPLISTNGKKTVDGLIVKNPRSFLFKDWARRDSTYAPLKKGFSFLMTNFGNTRYILGVDPDMGISLRGLGTLLNDKESGRRKKENRPFNEKWYEGNCPLFNFRIIDSPQDSSSLTHQEIVDTIREFSRS